MEDGSVVPRAADSMIDFAELDRHNFQAVAGPRMADE
jgi:hypothetical protein